MFRSKRQSEDDERPASWGIRLTLVILTVFAVLLSVALVQFFSYMYYCRIPLSACKTAGGETVLERAAIPLCSELGEYIVKSGLVRKYPWIIPYLQYRYYAVLDGVTTIKYNAFSGYVDLRGVRIPNSVTVVMSSVSRWRIHGTTVCTVRGRLPSFFLLSFSKNI